MGVPRKPVSSLFSRNSTAQAHADTQPGLEAVPVEGLEPVVDPANYHGLQVFEGGQQQQPQQPMYKYEGHENVVAEAAARKKKKWTMTIIIGIAIIIGVAIAVGVGVGVGLKKSDTKTENQPTQPGTNTTTPEPSTYVMNDDAPLAMTSTGRIFFQDRNGRIIFTESSQQTRKRAVGNQTILEIPNAIAPKKNTPLVSVDWDDGKQIYLFYITEDNALQDYVFTEDKWQQGRLGKGKFEAYGQSKLAAVRIEKYDEMRVFYQKGDAKLVELTVDLTAPLDTATWKETTQTKSLSSALLGSSLAAVSYFTDALRFYLQQEDRTIIEHCWSKKEPENDTDTSENDWGTCRTFDSTKDGSVEQRAKGLTAIAAARIEDKKNQTIMLYQAEDGTLASRRWDDDEETWLEAPTNAGKLADKGKVAARVDEQDLVTVIYRSEDEGLKSMTWDGDQGWNLDPQPVIAA